MQIYLVRQAMSATGAGENRSPKWDDFNKELGRVKVYAPDTSWIHIILAQRKEDLGCFLRLSKFRQAFNVNSPEDLASITFALEEAAEALGWTSGLNNFIKSVNKKKFRSKADEETIKHLRQRVRKYFQDRTTLRQEVLRYQLPSFKEDLAEFKTKLDSRVSETAIHDWLRERVWVFGTDYVNQQPKSFSEVGWVRSRFDFFLQRVDSFFDIVELKSPVAKLFVRKEGSEERIFPSRSSPLSSELQKSISQMMGYLERAALYENTMLRDRGILVHKPKGIIVIGRTQTDEREAVRTLNSYLHQIEILTYDDLMNRGKELVSIITKLRKPIPSEETSKAKPTRIKILAHLKSS